MTMFSGQVFGKAFDYSMFSIDQVLWLWLRLLQVKSQTLRLERGISEDCIYARD